MSLEFRHIAHAYGENRALDNISLTAPTGEITCLLGSSGCGKSTLLNLAAGLLPVQEGSIYLGGAMLADARTNPPPEDRPVGLVFQDGALFPHLTVARNVAFGLGKGAGGSGEVEKWLELAGLGGLGERYPRELSGGQQQRVALARAMAPGPQVLLMDEPFSSVDIVLRRSLRRDCRRILREQGATVILVTHDPEEALDIGDRIAVMHAGKIAQFGTPQELYEKPATPSVGAIFGGAQIVPADFVEGGLQTPFGVWPVASLSVVPETHGALDLLVRASELELVEDAGGVGVIDVRSMGSQTQVLLVSGSGDELAVDHGSSQGVSADLRYRVVPREQSILAFASK
ncbi:MAG: ABC transporter ATP-binding protein [Pseudomonadota bacterium]